MRRIYIDCKGVKSASEVWQRYLAASQPSGASDFGCNLDAFWDAIEAGGPGYPGEAILIFTHSADMEQIRLSTGGSLLDGLREIASDATQVKVKLT